MNNLTAGLYARLFSHQHGVLVQLNMIIPDDSTLQGYKAKYGVLWTTVIDCPVMNAIFKFMLLAERDAAFYYEYLETFKTRTGAADARIRQFLCLGHVDGTCLQVAPDIKYIPFIVDRLQDPTIMMFNELDYTLHDSNVTFRTAVASDLWAVYPKLQTTTKLERWLA